MTAGGADGTSEPIAVGQKDLRWGSDASARDRLFADASLFNFYQAVRVLLILQPGAAPLIAE